jgi:hypothetical protein
MARAACPRYPRKQPCAVFVQTIVKALFGSVARAPPLVVCRGRTFPGDAPPPPRATTISTVASATVLNAGLLAAAKVYSLGIRGDSDKAKRTESSRQNAMKRRTKSGQQTHPLENADSMVLVARAMRPT